MLKSGKRWWNSPPEYRPFTVIYRRLNHFSMQEVWKDVVYFLTGFSTMVNTTAIEFAHIKRTTGLLVQRGTARSSSNARWRTGDQLSCVIEEAGGRLLPLTLTPSHAHALSAPKPATFATPPIFHAYSTRRLGIFLAPDANTRSDAPVRDRSGSAS